MPPSVDTTALARLALACIEREYPNKLAHVMADARDVGTPRALTPAFYGCFDWHSAVHGHWLLVRLLRAEPDAPWAAQARDALGRNLTAENLAGELRYLDRPDRVGFERPYGLAWLLTLGTELRRWDRGAAIVNAIAPLERLAATRLGGWASKLGHAVRAGEHSCSAFAFGLVLDWARHAGDHALVEVLVRRSLALHGDDRGCALAFEPSGQDFLSPCLAAADLMRRVLVPDDFARWLTAALPDIACGVPVPLSPATPGDRGDGKLAHLDGLNLSRAWMLEGIAAGLPASDPRRPTLLDAARAHAAAGLAAVDGAHYEGTHWLGTFAVYLTTRAGLGEEP